MYELNSSTRKTGPIEAELCAEIGFRAAQARSTGRSRVPTSAAARKCQRIHQAIEAGGRDVKMGTEIRLERFQTQLSSTQMGNPG
jgi:hypothetical protein